jgi:Asp-tRNA(Asn)/Glu-tRNA(Gln) amidotransferase A subunit family amidase
MTGWERLGIGGLSHGYLSGELNPAVLDGVLARIAAVDGDLSAFVAINADRARRAAVAADAELKRGRWRGHLHGVPIAGTVSYLHMHTLEESHGSRAWWRR